MSVIFYLAWVAEGVAFNAGTHATVTQKVWDGTEGGEIVFSLAISHAEGAFPGLKAELVNPGVGLLSAGREQWVWLSADFGDGPEALLNGRIIGEGKHLTDEVIEVEFVCRPSNFVAQKAALADTMRVLPWWDPVWLQEDVDNPETVLEARNARWHINRLTLAVTASDNIAGEDGTIDVSADEHFYDGFDKSYGPQPRRRIKVTLTAGWPQTGSGQVDLTSRLVSEFQAAGSPYPWPMVSSFTADGLLSDWPKPLDDLGGGWSVSPDATAAFAPGIRGGVYAVRYVDKSGAAEPDRDAYGNVARLSKAGEFNKDWMNFNVLFELRPIATSFLVNYLAERKRNEICIFTVSADVQPILIDPDADEEETLELTSTFVGEPIDADPGSPGVMVMPIGDLRHNCYFPTDRGQLSVQYGMLVAVARLLSSARAVDIEFASTWEKLARVISCRKSVTLHDPRLPGGEATGKVIAYRLAADGEGEMIAEATLGCTIGYGIALPAAAGGEDTYADDYADDYTETTGREIAVIAGQVHYESLDGTYVLDDDGLDLFDMTERTVVNSLTVTGGPNEQRSAIDGNLTGVPYSARLSTTGDLAGTSVSNLTNVAGLIDGAEYTITGGTIPSLHGKGATGTTFTFAAPDGGTLSQAAPVAAIAVGLTISSAAGATLPPAPVAALGDVPTVWSLDLTPTTGGDFVTEYSVVVLPLVIAKTIDLEAA